MDNEVELISDGDGLAVIGKPTAVERFMASVGLSSNAGSPRLGAAFSAGASVAQTGSEIAANSGRWVKLTKESAQAVKKFGLMDTKTPGVSHAIVGQPGGIKQWIQIVRTTPWIDGGPSGDGRAVTAARLRSRGSATGAVAPTIAPAGSHHLG